MLTQQCGLDNRGTDGWDIAFFLADPEIVDGKRGATWCKTYLACLVQGRPATGGKSWSSCVCEYLGLGILAAVSTWCCEYPSVFPAYPP